MTPAGTTRNYIGTGTVYSVLKIPLVFTQDFNRLRQRHASNCIAVYTFIFLIMRLFQCKRKLEYDIEYLPSTVFSKSRNR